MLKYLSAMAAGVVLLTTAACSSTPTNHLDQGKADAAAWDSLHGVATTLSGLAKAGELKGQAAATAKVDLDQATAALTAADAAYQAGNNASAAQNVATATALIATLAQIAATAQGH